MTGAADGRLRGRSVQRAWDDPAWAGSSRYFNERAGGARAAKRPVALFVAGEIDADHMRERLESHFHVIPTTNLPSAVAVLGDVRLDLVLIDAALPDAAMMELITQVRVQQWLRDLPIICYGSADPGSAVSRLAGLAAHDVIVEPVSTDELVSRISAALSSGR